MWISNHHPNTVPVHARGRLFSLVDSAFRLSVRCWSWRNNKCTKKCHRFFAPHRSNRSWFWTLEAFGSRRWLCNTRSKHGFPCCSRNWSVDKYRDSEIEMLWEIYSFSPLHSKLSRFKLDLLSLEDWKKIVWAIARNFNGKNCYKQWFFVGNFNQL